MFKEGRTLCDCLLRSESFLDASDCNAFCDGIPRKSFFLRRNPARANLQLKIARGWDRLMYSASDNLNGLHGAERAS